ncbi:hypothetical protein, partial [Aphanothece microscopica]|uniref:hypothetical protein n=1 Tax=Aphanothece microscopica TaxID=1049561 RepID=UPI003CE530AB
MLLILPSPTRAEDPQACSPTPSFVKLDGRNVIELRSVPGAQNLQEAARRASKQLLELAEDRSIAPEQVVLKDSHPFVLIGVQKEGQEFKQLGAFDDRMAACFDINREALAKRSQTKIRDAIVRYRDIHSTRSWLKGTGLAAAVLLFYVLLLKTLGYLNSRAQGWIAGRQRFYLQSLKRLGVKELVEPDQIRGTLQNFRLILYWLLILVLSYLLIPLLLSLFPPTQGIAEGLRAQLRSVFLGAMRGVVGAIPNILSIAIILGITIVAIRISNGVFDALRLGRLRIPGFYREWARPTSRLVGILLTLVGLVSAFPYIPG